MISRKEICMTAEETKAVERMLTVNDIANIMGYSTHTVRCMVKDGVFPRVHRAELGDGRKGHIRIYLSDFEEWRNSTTETGD